jgi:SAM-dependent methyltransferase
MPLLPDRAARRLTFNEVAELYDRARPGYPAELFDDLLDLAGLEAGSRLVEIGCGTGQATRSLAERGLDVTCVELGEAMAAVAGDRLASFPNVRVVQAAFEDWEPEASGLDAIVAFTSFHWVDESLRFEKPARLLRPGGHLAATITRPVTLPEGDTFFVDVQEDYDAVVPDPDSRAPQGPEGWEDMSAEFDASGCFESPVVRRYVWERDFTADEYVDVLDTYSANRVLEPGVRSTLYERIHRRIESRPGGTVRPAYLNVLHVARRR